MRRSWIDTLTLIGTVASAVPLGGFGANAHESDSSMHRVSFAVERSREVENDWVRATVGITDQDSDAAKVAERVNEAMQWALAEAKQQKGVQVKSGAYQTHPISDDGRIRRWQASQEIIIEGPDVAPIGELIAKLQSRLQLLSLTFTVTPERRRQIEDDLVADSLAAFRRRADLVRRSLEASSYEIVSISIERSGDVAHRRFNEPRMMMESAVRTAPALEAGTSFIRVGANGTIELD